MLVLTAFTGPRPSARHQGCHNDGNPQHNARSNLRWDTPSSNALDAVRHGRHPFASRTSCAAGHPYTEENTRTRKSGARACRECQRASDRARYRRSVA